MASEEKPKKRSRSQDPKKKRKRSRKKKNTKKQFTSFSKCVPGSLAKVSDYIGIEGISEKMKAIEHRNHNFEKVVRIFVTNSDFQVRKIHCDKFDPLLVNPKHIFLLQLCSVHVDNNAIRDNFHSVALFDNKIFDVNIEQPLSLTKDNLNRCCLGDKWVYHHCSRVKQFFVKKWYHIFLIFYYCSIFFWGHFIFLSCWNNSTGNLFCIVFTSILNNNTIYSFIFQLFKIKILRTYVYISQICDMYIFLIFYFSTLIDRG